MKRPHVLYRTAPVDEPGLARWLFGDARSAWLWLALRLYVGWEWFNAGREKLWPASGSSWLSSGDGLKGYWTRAVSVPQSGQPPIVYGWYRDFLQYMLDNRWYSWFAGLVAAGEVLVGIALIVGAFVGIATFFGALMNFNYMLAGTASTNPLLFLIAILLIVAWRVSGVLGADRWLLPRVLTPWQWIERKGVAAPFRRRVLSDNPCPRCASVLSERVLETACSLAERYSASLTLLTVMLRFPESRLHVPMIDANSQERGRQYLAEVAQRVPVGTKPELAVRLGVPADEIQDYAREHGIDLIVMSTHGTTGIERTRHPIGSTAWAIL